PGAGAEARSWREGPVRSSPLAEQDGDVVGALVGHHQIGQAVTVQVADGNAYWVGAGEETLGRPELPAPSAQVDQHVVGAPVGDQVVGEAVAVEIGGGGRAGGEQAVAAVLHEALPRK